MARKTIVQLFDDIDGTAIDDGKGHTVAFGLEGKNYEIDLGDKNIERLRSALEPYIRVARRAEGRSAVGGRRSAGRQSGSGEAAAIRDWANANGVAVSQRGRISAEVRAQYLAATGR